MQVRDPLHQINVLKSVTAPETVDSQSGLSGQAVRMIQAKCTPACSMLVGQTKAGDLCVCVCVCLCVCACVLVCVCVCVWGLEV